MKKIIISEKNKTAIDTLIQEAEGKATVRTITFKHVEQIVKLLNEKFDIKKADKEGLRVRCDWHKQTYPQAYRYKPQSTQITVAFENGNWKLVEVYREDTPTYVGKNEGMFEIAYMPDATKKAIMARYYQF